MMLVDQLNPDSLAIEANLAHAVKNANARSYNPTQYLKQRFEQIQQWANYLNKLAAGAGADVIHVQVGVTGPTGSSLALFVQFNGQVIKGRQCGGVRERLQQHGGNHVPAIQLRQCGAPDASHRARQTRQGPTAGADRRMRAIRFLPSA